MNANKFWYTWLKVAAIIVTCLGVMITFFNQTPIFAFLNRQIEETFLLDPFMANAFADVQGWIISVLGATMAGWGLLMLFLIIFPLQRNEKWAWNALMISLLLWFSLDSIISGYYGAYFNVVINLVFFFQFAAPLFVLKNSKDNIETK